MTLRPAHLLLPLSLALCITSPAQSAPRVHTPTAAAISPDSRLVAYVSGTRATPQLTLAELAHPASTQIISPPGTCPNSDLNRTKINQMVQRMDRNNIITRPMLTMPGYESVEIIATERSWNGSGYACYLCNKQFASLQSLNNHLKSPVHEQSIYRCPGPGCGRNYKLLSGLIQHVESESCGVMRFAQVQQQAKQGIESMAGRMIGN